MYEFKVLKHLQVRPFVRRNVLFTSLIVAITIAMLWLPWQQTIKGVGVLTTINPVERNYKIVATIDGFIESINVKENQSVKKNDTLFSMRDLDNGYEERLSNIVQEYQNNLKNEKISYQNIEKNLKEEKQSIQISIEVYQTKLIQLQNKRQALQHQREAVINQYNIEKINYDRAERLFNAGIESKRGFELKKFAMLNTQAKKEKIRMEIKNIDNEIEIVKKEKRRFQHDSEVKLNNIQNKLLSTQSNINKLLQSIDSKSVTLSRYQSKKIVAKSDGHIVQIYQADQNKFLKKGAEIMTFSPKVNERAIRFKVPVFHMPLIKKGLKVRILFYGWPTLFVSGWPKISHGTYGGIIKSVEATSHEKGVYYAIIVEDKNDDPWPDEQYLRIGTETTVFVKLQTVTIGYELWRYLSAQPPKMMNNKLKE